MTMIEGTSLGRARMDLRHMRPKHWKYDRWKGVLVPDYRWVRDERLGSLVVDRDSCLLLGEDQALNVITTAGRDFLHQQGYATSGLGANGLNFIGLSNDTLTETTASTTLSAEIAANGLMRAAGTYAHTADTNTTTIDRTFTCATAPQAAQKAALFTAVSAGTMNHALAFTQRSLIIGDTLQCTFTITLG